MPHNAAKCIISVTAGILDPDDRVRKQWTVTSDLIAKIQDPAVEPNEKADALMEWHRTIGGAIDYARDLMNPGIHNFVAVKWTWL